MRSLFTPRTLVRHSFLAMGTDVMVTLAPRRRHLIKKAREAIVDVQIMIREFGRDGWAWGDGELGTFNRRLAAGERVAIPPALKPIFDRAWAIRQASDGHYEPRIAGLVHLWGFDDLARLRQQPPNRAEIDDRIAAMHRAPAYEAGSAHYGPAPQTGWDFGGIAKGYIVDRALDLLREAGFGDATVDAGGNVSARGRKHDRSWLIGIRKPLDLGDDPDTPSLLAVLAADNEAVNTHGDDQRFFIHEGRRYAHLLDPRSGDPVEGLRSLTVVHHDGMLAEAGGAALFVAGPGAWPALAAKLGIDQVLAVHTDGRVMATPALARRLRAEPGVVIQTVGLLGEIESLIG
ncbi:MAG: FAD:protein transferase [Hydrocarboniphaga sp.]|uniref:FAD:protein FMN transferase n=1 Tax=Hydrocarboniphaga sp. TaxID=2033016 RepID=UPI00260D2595|nr:FAD:protein FMN transferase [Hydrocarboniphaga sp.]MDB5969763.1 FAD:protein transferase [Hydrocarboniphaga sp.]